MTIILVNIKTNLTYNIPKWYYFGALNIFML